MTNQEARAEQIRLREAKKKSSVTFKIRDLKTQVPLKSIEMLLVTGILNDALTSGESNNEETTSTSLATSLATPLLGFNDM